MDGGYSARKISKYFLVSANKKFICADFLISNIRESYWVITLITKIVFNHKPLIKTGKMKRIPSYGNPISVEIYPKLGKRKYQ